MNYKPTRREKSLFRGANFFRPHLTNPPIGNYTISTLDASKATKRILVYQPGPFV